MGRFDRLMHQMPQIMAVAAAVVYASVVLVGIAAGDEVRALIHDTLSPIQKARAVVILFVQPIWMPLGLLFGAALLWRLDRYIDVKIAEAAE